MAADVVINLRHPIGGETSGTMIRSLGAGACIVVVDRGSFAEIPDDAAVRIPWVPDFAGRLAGELLRLALDADLRRAMGARARAFIASHHGLEHTVAGYVFAIKRALATPPPAWATEASWHYLPPHELARRTALARDRHGFQKLPLWFAAGIIPACGNRKTRLRVAGGHDEDRQLLSLLGYDPVENSTLELDPKAPDRTTDLMVILGGAASLGQDAGMTLRTLNRELAFGGILVWYIVRFDVDAPLHPLESRQSGKHLLEECGFRVEASLTGSPPMIDMAGAESAQAAEGQQRCWRAVKTSETFAQEDFSQMISDRVIRDMAARINAAPDYSV